MFQDNLSSVDTYIPSVKLDVKNFNDYVKLNSEGLKARGEQCPDLMANLFKGYRAASDKDFVRCIAQKIELFDNIGVMSEEQLIQFSLKKFTIISKQDTWNAKTQ